MKHLVLVSGSEFEDIISGRIQYLIRFFKKNTFHPGKGDLIYFRKKKGEILGQFNAGKMVFIEGVGIEDFKLIKNFSKDFTEEFFKEKIRENSIIIIVQIEKLEQFITSPIDVPKKGKIEWTILE